MTVVLKSRFPQIVARMNPAVEAALKAGAESMEREAKARVPVGAPDVHLRDAIHTERQGINQYAVVAGDTEVFYGHMVEFGTSHSAPHPFLVPAFETGREPTIQFIAAAVNSL